jgi:hypothetical protein
MSSNRRSAALFPVTALLVGVAILSGCQERIYLSQDEVEQRIKRELSPGTSPEQVEEFIKSFQSQFFVSRSDYRELISQPPDSSLDVPENKQLQPQGYIGCWIYRTGRSPKMFATWNIRMTFYFDKNRRLIGHQLRTVGEH